MVDATSTLEEALAEAWRELGCAGALQMLFSRARVVVLAANGTIELSAESVLTEIEGARLLLLPTAKEMHGQRDVTHLYDRIGAGNMEILIKTLTGEPFAMNVEP
eukprot:4577368-Prymnesium_polylepis.1